jgi:hypothetical protein
MDIEQARLLAQPNPNGGAPAKIFSRSEAAEMSRAADALGASDDPADRAVAATLERAVAGATDYAAAYVAAEKAARAFSGSWDRATLSDMVDEAVNAAF